MADARTHLAAATWHLGRAAMANPGAGSHAKDALKLARTWKPDSDLPWLREFLRHPDPPGDHGTALHAKLDAVHRALEGAYVALAVRDDPAGALGPALTVVEQALAFDEARREA